MKDFLPLPGPLDRRTRDPRLATGSVMSRRQLSVIMYSILVTSCSGAHFSGDAQREPSLPAAATKVESTQTIESNDASREDSVPAKPSKVESNQNQSIPADTPLETARQCLLNATGINVTSVTISGENCYPNQIDPNGADRDDFWVTINGDLLRSGWEFFSNKDQDIQINYRLGSPGTTTQNVSLQIVDCDKVRQAGFDISTGSGDGTKVLKAKRGDRFNIVATVTSGCYGRKDVYDMLVIKEKVFWIH